MNAEKKYSSQYFKQNFPEWKRKKDSVLLKYFYRPLSFYVASFACHLGLTSNRVSFISLLIAILGCVAFIPNNITANLLGCILITIWMVLDCVDGNLARCVKSYPYGEFIDAISSYTLIAFLFPCIGVAAYLNAGVLTHSSCIWLIFIGGLTGVFDSLSRLCYQKYQNNSLDYEKNSLKSDKGEAIKKESTLLKINDRINKEIALNGLLIPWLYVATITHTYDLFVTFYFLYYGATFLGTLIILIKKSKCLKKER